MLRAYSFTLRTFHLNRFINTPAPTPYFSPRPTSLSLASVATRRAGTAVWVILSTAAHATNFLDRHGGHTHAVAQCQSLHWLLIASTITVGTINIEILWGNREIPPVYELAKESELRESPYIIDSP